MAGISPNIMLWVGPFTTFHSAFVHANLNWTLGPFKYVLATPVFHRWHHTSQEEGGNTNFAGTFPLWDICSERSGCRKTCCRTITASTTISRSRPKSADNWPIRSATSQRRRAGKRIMSIDATTIYQAKASGFGQVPAWLWLGAGLYVLLLVNNSGLLNDFDTYWQIAVGQLDSRSRGPLPRVDVYSFTKPGEAWLFIILACANPLCRELQSGGLGLGWLWLRQARSPPLRPLGCSRISWSAAFPRPTRPWWRWRPWRRRRHIFWRVRTCWRCRSWLPGRTG